MGVACMRGLLGWILLVCSALVSAQPAPPGEVRLVSEVWPGHTEADGSGLAWDIMRAVFEPAGLRVVVHSEPYMRSIGLVLRGRADAWIGSYAGEIAEAHYPQQAYDADPIVALGLASLSAPSRDTIGQRRLIWVRGYDYQHRLANVQHFQEIRMRTGILQMLERGYADFYVDALSEVEAVLAESSQAQRYQVVPLLMLPLYPGFQDSPRGRELAELYDRRLLELRADGSLRALFAKWGQPYRLAMP